ncbi:hypothetical protein CLV28_0940 [Sediminihabitans luteus]|uniref:Uncharacterized protein n=1 Tax=Sediminihabitans luteus TaxID=1138585 RepID=A0A2M9D0J1_9CELL|nr:hypothetical protein [Sediminihabitans luteus]PJJ77714.1 hypothetical protein CLV28_0940 [Sediminihabitans luteus]
MSYGTMADVTTALVALVGVSPEKAQAWCDGVGSTQVRDAIDDWSLWYSSELMLARDGLVGLHEQLAVVRESLEAADAELGRAAS